GFSQSHADADLVRLAAHGWGWVRRPTGGKAILHTDELTYSLSLPADHPLAAQSIVESYREISRALMHALTVLGAATHSERRPADSPKASGAVCFEVPSHYEITVEGRKLVGSAQVRPATSPESATRWPTPTTPSARPPAPPSTNAP
nr:hypothetical protein [Anaerolineae bacterium]